MKLLKSYKKGNLSIETVIIIVLFMAVLAIILLIVSSLTGKGSDQMGNTIDVSGDGALCEIECMKCCGSQVSEDCNSYVDDEGYGSCCRDTNTTEFWC